jgi:hypothetical protein
VIEMSRNRYQLLGYVVWQGGKWYLRRRLPSRRRLATRGLMVGGALASGAVLIKRLTG